MEEVSIREASELSGVPYVTLYYRVRMGQLPSRQIGAMYIVKMADVEQVKAAYTPGKRGLAFKRSIRTL